MDVQYKTESYSTVHHGPVQTQSKRSKVTKNETVYHSKGNVKYASAEPNENLLDNLLQELKAERENPKVNNSYYETSTKKYEEISGDNIVPSHIQNQNNSMYEIKKYHEEVSTDNMMPSLAQNKNNTVFETKRYHEEISPILTQNKNNTVFETKKYHEEVSRENIIPILAQNKNNTVFETKKYHEEVNRDNIVPALVQNKNNSVSHLSLSDEILPIPGTKVTTTVRTYTYEIPADRNIVNLEQLVNHKGEAQNDSVLQQLELQSKAYNNQNYSSSYSTLNKDDILSKTENTNHYYSVPQNVYSVLKYRSNSSMALKENVNSPDYGKDRFYRNTELNDVNLNNHPISYDQTDRHPYSSTQKLTVTEKYPITNSYTYETRTYDRHGPFDKVDNTSPNPPTQLNELMANFEGNTTKVNEIPHRSKKEIETGAAVSVSPKKDLTKNVAGHEVYYPPGHNSLRTYSYGESKSSARAGGEWEKSSAMREYESKSKSKSYSKSGGAFVPVCLPLCCAMPCSIM